MRILIQSPQKIVHDLQHIYSFHAILSDGNPISVLNNHAPLIGQLAAGEIKYSTKKDSNTIKIPDAVMIIEDNLIKILTVNEPKQVME